MYADTETAYAAKAAQSMYASAAPSTRQPLLAEIGLRLSRLQDEIGAADKQSSELRERLFGPWPVRGDEANGPINKASQGDEVLRALDALIARASSVYENVSVLNNSI